MSGRVLVTGATGLLGSSVVDAFRAAGWDVRGLVRDPDQAGWLAALGVELAAGDLGDEASIRTATVGCDVVVHAAAAIGAGSDPEAFERVNVAGTQAVVAAAYRAGARLVHMSSTAVYSARSRARPIVDEGTPFGELDPTDAYGRSKQMAERVVETACRTGAMWATVIRPTMMYGLRDRQFVPRIAPVLERGFMPLIEGGETRMTIVAARSVAEVALLAASSDVACGRAYVVADDVPTTVRTVVEAASAGLARPIRSPHVPTWVGRGAFALLHGWLRLTGRPDLARRTSGTFRTLVRDNPFTSDRARSELGWRPAVEPSAELERAFRRWAREQDRKQDLGHDLGHDPGHATGHSPEHSPEPSGASS